MHHHSSRVLTVTLKANEEVNILQLTQDEPGVSMQDIITYVSIEDEQVRPSLGRQEVFMLHEDEQVSVHSEIGKALFTSPDPTRTMKVNFIRTDPNRRS